MFNLFKSFAKKESAPEPVVGKALAEAYNQSRDGEKHTCFCYAPFSNMLFSQSGNVNVCCHNLEFSIGKYPEQSLKEIWNSAKANELRNHMRRYDLSHGCGICEADLRMGSFQEVRARHFDHIPHHPKYPTMMEFLVSNQCNLECVMCKGEFSSLIRKNREKLPPIVTPYDKEFLRQLEEFIPYLHETRFSGSGEAFSIDMNYEIWEMLIRLNPKCIIMVQTNGTILTDRVKDMLNRGNFQIGVSLDSLKKETYESIRLNANFDKVMDNIRLFNEYSQRKKMDFRVAMCAMRQNWQELPHFIKFGNSLNAVSTFHKVWFPREYALHNLPSEQLKEMHSYLSSFDFPAETELQKMNRNHYRYFVSVVKHWMDDAIKIEEEARIGDRLPFGQLLPYIESRLSTLIAAENLPEAVKNQDLQACLSNLQAVLNKFNEQDREALLRKMCYVTTVEMKDALKQNPAENLYEMAKKFITGELVA